LRKLRFFNGRLTPTEFHAVLDIQDEEVFGNIKYRRNPAGECGDSHSHHIERMSK